jgi:hypothetical protein
MCIGGVAYNCGNISGWPPLPYPLFSSPPQQPPQQPPPNPPPPGASVEIRYFLSFLPFVGVNVKVFSSEINDYILPSSKPIALQWQYYPQHSAHPRIFAETANSLIATNLRPRGDEYGRLYVFPDLPVPYPPLPLVVAQFLFHEHRWIVVIHEVYFPRMPDPERATPQDYQLAIENRTEKLVMFYDSLIHGLGDVEYLGISLTPEVALIDSHLVPPPYRIHPTSSPAYCMFIRPQLCPSLGGGDE